MNLTDRLNAETERLGLEVLLASDFESLFGSHVQYDEDHNGHILVSDCVEEAMLSDGHNLIHGERYPAGEWVRIDHDDPRECDVCGSRKQALDELTRLSEELGLYDEMTA